MNTQKTTKLRSSNKDRSVYNKNTWNNIKEIINTKKAQKKAEFEEKFSEVIKLFNNKTISLKSEPIEKTIITTVPKNIEPGQIFELFIDGVLIKVKCPLNSKSYKKISLKIQNRRDIYQEIQHIIKLRKNYKIMYETGKYYGYPKCCINDFVLRTHNDQTHDHNQELAGQWSGYVPCIKCSEKIVTNNSEIKHLIKDRKCKTSFPVDDEANGFIPCKNHARLIFFKKMTFNQVTRIGCNQCIEFSEGRDHHTCCNTCTCKNTYHH